MWKCSYIMSFGIGPYFQSLLYQTLKEAPYFVFFDSGIILQTWSQLDRHCNSEFLRKAIAVDVDSKFQSCAKSLNTRKMIQVFHDFFPSFSVIW